MHGDDFTTSGPKCELDWFEAELEGKYELKKGGRLGPAPTDTKELTVLNRVLRWTADGIEYEADPRQGERLVEGLGLDSGCKATATPGLKPLIEKLVDDKVLSAEAHSVFRACSSRKLPGSGSTRPPVFSEGGVPLYECPDRVFGGSSQANGSIPTWPYALRL